jgi:CO/xanthine dehydrogenase Mo-binding subunit
MKNLVKEGSLLSVGTPLPKGVSIDQVLQKCAERVGWKQTPAGWEKPIIEGSESETHLMRGVGIACGYKNVGFSFGAPENCWATIELHGEVDIQEVVLRHAAAEVGQGTHTALAQMAADAIGVPMERVRMILSDTAETDNSGSVSASRMTFMAGNAILGAAKQALEHWEDEERPAIGRFQYRPPTTTPFDPQTGKSEPNFAYGYVAEAVVVEVDRETGKVRLLNVICADDVGHAINPKQVQGQIEGAIVQASGYVLLEDFQQVDGEVRTDQLSTYLIPTILDIPGSVESVILEYPDPIGPWGARGMAEMPYIPLAPAITSAVWDASGIWFDEFPLIPERVLRELKSSKVE